MLYTKGKFQFTPPGLVQSVSLSIAQEPLRKYLCELNTMFSYVLLF